MSDLTEKSLEEIIEAIDTSKNFSIRPTRFIVPPWVYEEIRQQYGDPVTEEKYFQWKANRLENLP
jgi:hypothetical protein